MCNEGSDSREEFRSARELRAETEATHALLDKHFSTWRLTKAERLGPGAARRFM